MPPKRRPKTEEADEAASPPSKKAKLSKDSDTEEEVVKGKGAAANAAESSDSEDDRTPCHYGATCYRKNPQHFVEFSHPHLNDKPKKKKDDKKGAAVKKAKEPKKIDKMDIDEDVPVPMHKNGSAAMSPDKAVGGASSASVDNYKIILKMFLSKNKISAEDKRKLRTHRREHGISDQDHFAVMAQLGWTEDEYDDGEKRDDDIDLEEERKVLEDENGFKIISIKKENAHKSKETLHTFSKVCTKFYETMSKAQANFTVSEVGVVVNSKTKTAYTSKKMTLGEKRGGEPEEVWGFHGTSSDSIEKICATNFLRPDDLKKKTAAAKGKGKGGKHLMKDKPVELLDDGYYGKGIYFTMFSDYALWYSEERDSDKILLCKLLPGKSYKCYKRIDGQGLQPGHDSHTSPKGNELVIFEPNQILPRYVITFVEKDAEEREQES